MPRAQLRRLPVGGELLADRGAIPLLAALGIGLVGLWALTGLRVGAQPGAIELRLDANGAPDLWGTPSTLWRLPVIATLLALMNVAVAAVIAPGDRFGARFAIGAGLLVQVLLWVAFLGLAW